MKSGRRCPTGTATQGVALLRQQMADIGYDVVIGRGDYSEEEATKILSSPKVTALIDLKAGDAKATAWGCDLTYDYVKINGDYRT